MPGCPSSSHHFESSPVREGFVPLYSVYGARVWMDMALRPLHLKDTHVALTSTPCARLEGVHTAVRRTEKVVGR